MNVMHTLADMNRQPAPNELAVVPPHLAVGDRILMGAAVYELAAKAPGRRRFSRLDQPAEDVWLDNVDLVAMMARREVTVASPSWLNEARSKLWEVPFEARPEIEKRLARRRHDFVQAFLENRRQGQPLRPAEVLARVHARRMQDPANIAADEKCPALSAVYNWLKLWEQEGVRSVKRLCFAESSRGRSGVHLDPAVVPIVRDALRELWYTPQRHRVRTVWDRVIAAAERSGVPVAARPCQRTLRRLIAQLPPYAAARIRHGARAADHKYRSVGKMAEAALPGEVHEIDAHKLDMFAVDDRTGLPLGRLWVTLVVDRCSRCIVGLHLHVEPPSSLTVAAALRNAFAPKLYMRERWPEIDRCIRPWGLPNLLVLDNALENRATFLTEALEELGVAWLYARPNTPEDKPFVERLNGTLARDFSARLPGWTGADVRERGDYDAEGMACLALDQADELLHRWAVNYNMGWHSGIRDVPDRCYMEHAGEAEAVTVEDLGILDVLLGDFAERTVTRQGIFLLGLRYGDRRDYRPLEHLRTRAGTRDVLKVRIRFDRSDLSRIHVQDPVTREYVPVPSLDPEYTDGLTLARHRIVRRHAVERARGHVSVAELCTARDDLQRRIDEMTGHEPMGQRKFAAMFRGLGSKGSWGEFHRLANAEYGTLGRDARPIVDLLNEDEFDATAMDEAPPPARPAQARARRRAARNEDNDDLQARAAHARAAYGVEAAAEAEPPEPPEAPEVNPGESRAARLRNLGMVPE